MADPSKTLTAFKAPFEDDTSQAQTKTTLAVDEDTLLVRLLWVSRMRTVALSLGEEKTRSEMIEYLCKKIEAGILDDTQSLGDEVLTAIAEVLGGFEDFVGGPKEAHCLLKPLDLLCKVDESTVRNQAVLAINTVATKLTADQLFINLVPKVFCLTTKDWFTPRVSACGLVATAYKACVECSSSLSIDMSDSGHERAQESQTWAPNMAAEQLIETFKKQCADEPMVRGTAAIKMADVAEAFGPEVVTSYLVEIWCTLVEKPMEDSTRVNALKSAPAIFNVVALLDTVAGEKFTVCAQDTSWRVRVAVAESLPGVAHSLKQSSDEPTASLKAAADIFLSLTKDKEGEVRQATAAQAAAAAQVLSTEWASTELFPKVMELVLDENTINRVALAGVLIEMSEPLGPTITKEKFLGHSDLGMSLLQHLLQKENSNLRLMVISKLMSVVSVIGIKQAWSIFELMCQLLEDKNWRVRHATMQLLPGLALEMGREDFDRTFAWMYLGSDNCALIRTDWVQCCVDVAQVAGFGAGWVEEHVLPKLLESVDMKNYQMKAVLLTAMTVSDAALSKMLGNQIIESQLLPKAITMCSDNVPNLALQAAEAVGAVAINEAVTTAVIEGRIKPALLQCLKKGPDGAKPDKDVDAAAAEALTQLGVSFERDY